MVKLSVENEQWRMPFGEHSMESEDNLECKVGSYFLGGLVSFCLGPRCCCLLCGFLSPGPNATATITITSSIAFTIAIDSAFTFAVAFMLCLLSFYSYFAPLCCFFSCLYCCVFSYLSFRSYCLLVLLRLVLPSLSCACGFVLLSFCFSCCFMLLHFIFWYYPCYFHFVTTTTMALVLL